MVNLYSKYHDFWCWKCIVSIKFQRTMIFCSINLKTYSTYLQIIFNLVSLVFQNRNKMAEYGNYLDYPIILQFLTMLQFEFRYSMYLT